MFKAKYWRDGGYIAESLATADREEAESRARALQGRLAGTRNPRKQDSIRLGELVARFASECRSWKRTKPKTQKDGVARAKLLVAYFGSTYDLTKLSHDELDGYVDARTAGHIVLDGQPVAAASTRSAQADIHFLNRMLYWAASVRLPGGAFWLARNPAKEFEVKIDATPNRPYSDSTRLNATLAAVEELLGEARATHFKQTTDPKVLQRRERRRLRMNQVAAPPAWAKWLQLRLALILVDAYGRRLSSIRQLRWSDVAFEQQTICWRAETDKTGRRSIVPLPEHVAVALKDYRQHLPGVGEGWVFAALKNPAEPSDRHLFDAWLRQAELRANLPKLKGGLWHPFRRRWAMDRKKYPISDVMEVGGWRDHETLLQCYQQPDEATMREVLEGPRRQNLVHARKLEETPVETASAP